VVVVKEVAVLVVAVVTVMFLFAGGALLALLGPPVVVKDEISVSSGEDAVDTLSGIDAAASSSKSSRREIGSLLFLSKEV
jgi:hypothetical protein